MKDKFSTNTEGQLFIRAADNVLLVKKSLDSEPETVLRIDTVSRTYITHSSAIGDAIRNNIPLLTPDVHSSDGKGNVTVYGFVFGHPDRPDGTRIETSAIKTLHLVNGSSIDTRLGRLEKEQGGNWGRGLAQAIIAEATGRKHNLK